MRLIKTIDTTTTITNKATPTIGIAIEITDAATVPTDSAPETTGLANPALTAVES